LSRLSKSTSPAAVKGVTTGGMTPVKRLSIVVTLFIERISDV
jgi:hypothetical protein